MKKRGLLTTGISFLMLSLGACSQGPSSYFPLSKGRTWTYEMSLKTAFGQRESATLTITNLSARQLHNKTVIPQKTQASAGTRQINLFDYVVEGTNGTYVLAEQGPADVEPNILSPPQYVLKEPLRTGTSWNSPFDFSPDSSGPNRATIESTDETVDVPAGTFNGCLKIRISKTSQGSAIKNAYEWFAPTVGLVRVVSEADGSSLQLMSFRK